VDQHCSGEDEKRSEQYEIEDIPVNAVDETTDLDIDEREGSADGKESRKRISGYDPAPDLSLRRNQDPDKMKHESREQGRPDEGEIMPCPQPRDKEHEVPEVPNHITDAYEKEYQIEDPSGGAGHHKDGIHKVEQSHCEGEVGVNGVE